MKLRTYFLTVATLILLSLGQNVFAQVSLPDYSKWQNVSNPVQGLYNSKDVTLTLTTYLKENPEKWQLVEVISDENKKPLFLIYIFYVQTPDHKNEKLESHLFEYQGVKWVYLKNFSDSDDLGKEFFDLLKSKGLELK